MRGPTLPREAAGAGAGARRDIPDEHPSVDARAPGGQPSHEAGSLDASPSREAAQTEGSPSGEAGPPDVDGGPATGVTLELANEYALVQVRQVQTRNGTRLEILAPRLGRAIRLCPVELESLTWQPHETFSKFLETPFGPEDEA